MKKRKNETIRYDTKNNAAISSYLSCNMKRCILSIPVFMSIYGFNKALCNFWSREFKGIFDAFCRKKKENEHCIAFLNTICYLCAADGYIVSLSYRSASSSLLPPRIGIPTFHLPLHLFKGDLEQFRS